MEKKSPLIKADELSGLMTDKNLVLIDARTGPGVRDKYNQGHLVGALFVDLETEMSRKKDPARGGRHPLPPIDDFGALLGRLGIDLSSRVIIYDDKNGANAAARFWWMLRSAGHENVQVLDGGLQAAINAGFTMDDKVPVVDTKPKYPVEKWFLPIADIDQAAEAATDPGSLVIDVREAFRYRGESEPIDLVAGHIPGAVNIPYTGNLGADGQFLSADELAAKYQEALKSKDSSNVIVHCGSGVTACHTLLAMDQAGMKIPALYVGSWSEWSRNEKPIATIE